MKQLGLTRVTCALGGSLVFPVPQSPRLTMGWARRGSLSLQPAQLDFAAQAFLLLGFGDGGVEDGLEEGGVLEPHLEHAHPVLVSGTLQSQAAHLDGAGRMGLLILVT